MATKDDILKMIAYRGYRALFPSKQPHDGLFTFLVFDHDRYHHWSITEWIVNKNEDFIQNQVDTMLYDKFGSTNMINKKDKETGNTND